MLHAEIEMQCKAIMGNTHERVLNSPRLVLTNELSENAFVRAFPIIPVSEMPGSTLCL